MSTSPTGSDTESESQSSFEVERFRETLRELPPSAKLVARVLDSQAPLSQIVDPLPQALILTAIVIGFGVMGFLLALVVVTGRTTQTLEVELLADQGQPGPSTTHE